MYNIYGKWLLMSDIKSLLCTEEWWKKGFKTGLNRFCKWNGPLWCCVFVDSNGCLQKLVVRVVGLISLDLVHSPDPTVHKGHRWNSFDCFWTEVRPPGMLQICWIILRQTSIVYRSTSTGSDCPTHITQLQTSHRKSGAVCLLMNGNVLLVRFAHKLTEI